MTNVGYGYQPQGVVDLASIQQNRERLKMLKQQQQQAQMEKAFLTVDEAYKEMKKKEKYEKQLAELKKKVEGKEYLEKIMVGPEEITSTYETPQTFGGGFGGFQMPGMGVMPWGGQGGGIDYWSMFELERGD